MKIYIEMLKQVNLSLKMVSSKQLEMIYL